MRRLPILLAFLNAACSHTSSHDTYSQEIRAITCIRTIHTAQTQYLSEFNHYASSLKELGPPEKGVATARAADLIDAELASGARNGYRFVMIGNQTGYTITAAPLVFTTPTDRTFYSDQTMTVHEHYGPEPATANDPEGS